MKPFGAHIRHCAARTQRFVRLHATMACHTPFRRTKETPIPLGCADCSHEQLPGGRLRRRRSLTAGSHSDTVFDRAQTPLDGVGRNDNAGARAEANTHHISSCTPPGSCSRPALPCARPRAPRAAALALCSPCAPPALLLCDAWLPAPACVCEESGDADPLSQMTLLPENATHSRSPAATCAASRASSAGAGGITCALSAGREVGAR